ncbi:MAG TPA: hypothetical protein DD856_07020 [Sulfobacillus sp.]|nr:hypothetical protein [Sulfobacillus sp.]
MEVQHAPYHATQIPVNLGRMPAAALANNPAVAVNGHTLSSRIPNEKIPSRLVIRNSHSAIAMEHRNDGILYYAVILWGAG